MSPVSILHVRWCWDTIGFTALICRLTGRTPLSHSTPFPPVFVDKPGYYAGSCFGRSDYGQGGFFSSG
jgi:hypothetical protein